MLQRNSYARPYGFKKLKPRKKPTTVIRQLTKSQDLRQNYICEFHLRFECHQPLSLSVLSSQFISRSGSLPRTSLSHTETLPLFTFVVVSRVVAVHLQLDLAAYSVPSRLTETLPLFTFIIVSLVAVHLQLDLAAYSVPSRLTETLPTEALPLFTFVGGTPFVYLCRCQSCRRSSSPAVSGSLLRTIPSHRGTPFVYLCRCQSCRRSSSPAVSGSLLRTSQSHRGTPFRGTPFVYLCRCQSCRRSSSPAVSDSLLRTSPSHRGTPRPAGRWWCRCRVRYNSPDTLDNYQFYIYSKKWDNKFYFYSCVTIR